MGMVLTTSLLEYLGIINGIVNEHGCTKTYVMNSHDLVEQRQEVKVTKTS
jgi:hypothetical protein